MQLVVSLVRYVGVGGVWGGVGFFFQAEDGIRDLVRSRGLGDVYKRQTARARSIFDRTHARVRESGRELQRSE